jgi:hypothetical protein
MWDLRRHGGLTSWDYDQVVALLGDFQAGSSTNTTVAVVCSEISIDDLDWAALRSCWARFGLERHLTVIVRCYSRSGSFSDMLVEGDDPASTLQVQIYPKESVRLA